jgi:hypothetical protein
MTIYYAGKMKQTRKNIFIKAGTLNKKLIFVHIFILAAQICLTYLNILEASVSVLGVLWMMQMILDIVLCCLIINMFSKQDSPRKIRIMVDRSNTKFLQSQDKEEDDYEAHRESLGLTR